MCAELTSKWCDTFAHACGWEAHVVQRRCIVWSVWLRWIESRMHIREHVCQLWCLISSGAVELHGVEMRFYTNSSCSPILSVRKFLKQIICDSNIDNHYSWWQQIWENVQMNELLMIKCNHLNNNRRTRFNVLLSLRLTPTISFIRCSRWSVLQI